MSKTEHLSVSKSIESHYLVESTIGSGTFGDVKKARLVCDPRRVVALKVLRNVDAAPGAMNRLREVIFFKHVAHHPNIVTLYDMFRDSETATVVFALELMDGTLLHFMDQATRARAGPFDFFMVGCILKDLLKGVEHIHASGFVHRDLKPENILFSTDGQGRMAVKIADFGLCRPIEEPPLVSSRWTTYVATRWYRAPEQVLGLTFHTPALDIWATSLILYEVCNQVPMFPGRTMAEMVALHVQTLKPPGPNSTGGSCPVLAHRLSIMDDWKEITMGAVSRPRTSFIRWNEHHLYMVPMIAGLQWDPAKRPSASVYLLMIRRLLQSEWKRQGRPRQTTRAGQPRNQSHRAEHMTTGHNALKRFMGKKRPPTM